MANKLYRPSNGSEGEMFMEDFCFKCKQWPDDPEAKDQCDIVCRSFCYRIDELEYPKEWRYVDGKPCCTAFAAKGDKP